MYKNYCFTPSLSFKGIEDVISRGLNYCSSLEKCGLPQRSYHPNKNLCIFQVPFEQILCILVYMLGRISLQGFSD